MILEPLRTPNPSCPACRNFVVHTPEEYKIFHPLAGTGEDTMSGKSIKKEVKNVGK